MAAAVYTLVAAPVVARKRVTLRNLAGSITLSSTDREVDFDKLAPTWVQIDRPQRYALDRPGSPQLREVALTAYLYDYYHHDAPVDTLLARLRQIAASADPVIVNNGASDSGYFHIGDLKARSLRKKPGTNQVTRFEVSLRLTEHIFDPKKPKAPLPPSKPATKVKIHVVKQGESLSQIAAKECGSAGHAARIATDNKITDPRKLKVGTRLRITC